MEKILETAKHQINMLLEEKNFVIVAIDGKCTSGKTTLASQLAEIYDCNVFHMDDFFLRPEQRTPERFAEVGGNVDYERFQEEVLLPLKSGKAFSYRPFDCSTFTLADPVAVTPKRLNIIEGTYSHHPYFGNPYDLKILLTVDEETGEQLKYPGDGECILTNKLAKTYDLQVGDTVNRGALNDYDTNNRGICIGDDSEYPGREWPGDIDAIRIMNKCLSAEEIAKGMQQIIEATEKDEVADTMDNIKKIVEEIPYLQIPREEDKEKEDSVHIETDEEIDGSLRINFQEMIGEESDGQMSLVMNEKSMVEHQITGQMTISDILEEWEKT